MMSTKTPLILSVLFANMFGICKAENEELNIKCPAGEQLLFTIPGRLTNKNFLCVKLEDSSCIQECYTGNRHCHVSGTKRPGTYDENGSLVYINELYKSNDIEWKTCCISRQFIAKNCSTSIVYNSRYHDGKMLFNSNPFSITELKLGLNTATRFISIQAPPNMDFSYAMEACAGEKRSGGSFCDPCGNCKNGAQCNSPTEYPVPINTTPLCNCQPGWTGVYCETNIDECMSNVCTNEATCVDDINGYNCSCIPGYMGQYCETEINECESNPCANEASCIDHVNGYVCNCLPGFDGTLCDKDLCEINPCWNGGTCLRSQPYNFTCFCQEKYTGILCENEIPTTTTIPVTLTTYYKFPFDFNSFLDRVQDSEGDLVSTDWCNPNQCPAGGKCSNVGIGYRCKYNCLTMTIYPGTDCTKETTTTPMTKTP